MSAFQKSFPLISTSFINRCGNIGLSLVPMLLVEKKFTIAQSSLVMGSVKSLIVLGAFLGGFLSDRLGGKFTLLLSFMLSAIGMGFLPFSFGVISLTIFAALAQLGSSLFKGPSRLLLTELVDPPQQKESVAWLRMANNGAQILSFGIGAIFARAGFMPLMLFDAITSFLAAIFGWKKLPYLKPKPSVNVEEHREGNKFSWQLLLGMTLTTASYTFLYQIFLVGVAALLKLKFSSHGLELYSLSMVMNTFLCALLAIKAARMFSNPRFALPFGMILLTIGCSLTTMVETSKYFLFLGMLIITVGEIIFSSLGPFMLIQVSSSGSKNRGSIYGMSLVIQEFGAILGAALGFPIVLGSSHPMMIVLGLGIGMVVISLWTARKYTRVFQEGL